MAWTLIIKQKKSAPPSYQVSDGKTKFAVSPRAQCFRAEDAADGMDVIVERAKDGQPAKVTIPGKPEVQASAVNGGQAAGKLGRGGGQRREEEPPKRNAKAPYNFVTATEPLAFPSDDGPRYAGVLVCCGTALTPMLVAGPQPDRRTDGPAERRFFEVAGRPVIPGSSLKGLLRMGVEALSRATMAGLVSDTIIAFRDVGTRESAYSQRFKTAREEGRLRAGFLEEHGADRSIVPCDFVRVSLPELGLERINGLNGSADRITSAALKKNKKLEVSYQQLTDADPDGVSIAASPRFGNGGDHVGRLVATGWMPGRKGSPDKTKGYVFQSTSGHDALAIDDQVWEDFVDQLTPAQEALLKTLRTAGLQVPLFYLVEEGSISAIGLSRYFRVCTRHSPKDLAGEEPRAADVAADLPRRIFGSVRPARRGRVRVTAGTFAAAEKAVRFPAEGALVAGNPAASAVAMYLVQDSPQTKFVASYNTRRNEDLVTYDSDGPVLRGRKFYWHRQNPAAPNPPNDNLNVQSIYHPLPAGSAFTFTVAFERLALVELGGLLESLALPDGHAHKLGLGKPLGLGSVRIDVDWPASRIADIRDRYRSLRRRLVVFQDNAALQPPELQKIVDAARAAFKAVVEKQAGGKPGSFETLEHVTQFRRLTDWDRRPNPRDIEYMPLSKSDKADKGEQPTYATKAILPDPSTVQCEGRHP